MSNDTSLTVSRTIPASSKELFEVLTLPSRHQELDGSGFVRGLDHGDRITATGQSFRMNMCGAHAGGDYQTDNVVSGYAKDTLVAWKTGQAGTEPPGWEWVWELAAQGPDSTEVTLTYDWGKVTDPAVLKQIPFPLVDKAALEHSLERLAEAMSGS